jgi:large subunit ribosomal protein L6
MSKIGQKPVSIPSSVQLTVNGRTVQVKGAKGELTFTVPHSLSIVQEGDTFLVKRANENKRVKALHGLYRSLIANAVHGVEKGWEKKLEIVGTGFNVKMQGVDLAFKIGYSHPVVFKSLPGIQFQVEGNNKVIVNGIDKHLVGQTAHQIKMIREPDAYKGKGIRYEGEVVRIKPGKKAKA